MNSYYTSKVSSFILVVYRKISNTIRTIFTKNRGPAARVRIIHLN